MFSIAAIAADITWFFQGMEEFGRIVKRNVFFKALNIAFIFMFVKNQNDLLIYIGGLSLISLLSSLSLWPYLKGNIGKPRKEYLMFKDIFPEVLTLFIPSVAISVYTVLDKTMIGLITDSSFENGYYEQALKISRMALTIVTSLGIVMVPRIGHLFFENQMDKVKSYMYKSYRFVWMAGIPLCLGLIGIAPNFVPWFFGAGYEKVVPLLRISSFLILAVGISNVTGVQYLVPTKREKWLIKSVIIGAVVNFFLNIFMIRYFEAAGATVASVIAEFVITISQLIIIRHEICGKEILKSATRYFVSGIVMLTVILLIEAHLSPSLINSVILIMIGGVVYILMLFILKDEFFLMQVKLIKKLFEKR